MEINDYDNMVGSCICVPSERIVGRKIIQIKERPGGTHGASFELIVCTKRSAGKLQSFPFYHCTHESSFRDKKEHLYH